MLLGWESMPGVGGLGSSAVRPKKWAEPQQDIDIVLASPMASCSWSLSDLSSHTPYFATPVDEDVPGHFGAGGPS